MNSLVDIFYESFQDYSYEKIKETFDAMSEEEKIELMNQIEKERN